MWTTLKSLRGCFEIEIMNAILYISQWRLLPEEFGPWQTVYYYFRKWKLEGVIEDIMTTLHSLARKIVGMEGSPSMGIIDSRSVKTSHHADPGCKGRKEHIVIDILEPPMAVAVHEVHLHDGKGSTRFLQDYA